MSTLEKQPLVSPGNTSFSAYELLPWTQDMPIRPATLERDWMDVSRNRFAYRCLPLTIANQAGWVIENPVTFTAVWDGGLDNFNVRVRFENDTECSGPTVSANVITVAAGLQGLDPDGPGQRDSRINSHFGSGVVTICIPYLFRTPPLVNLWVKGPSNWIKDGAHPLEGIVETDWSPATFTMNWKLTRANYPVCFKRGEPICMLVPLPRGFAEKLHPVRAPIDTWPELDRQYREWQQSRAEFLAAYCTGAPEAKAGWQRHYTKGEMPGGAAGSEHQTHIRLREFSSRHECASAFEREGGTSITP